MAEKPRKGAKSFRLSAETLAFPLFFAGIAIAAWFFREPLAALFRDRESIRSWIESKGRLGPLAFLGMQVLQVVVFIIPGEIVQIAGGFALGFLEGTALSVAGIAIGSIFNYGVGRALGRPFVAALLNPERLERAERVLADRRAEAGYFLLFLIPGIPKDVLCYLAGMAKAPPLVFLAASMAARLPGIVGSALIGVAAYAGNVPLTIAILSLAAVLLIAGILWRRPLEKWIGKAFRLRK